MSKLGQFLIPELVRSVEALSLANKGLVSEAARVLAGDEPEAAPKQKQKALRPGETLSDVFRRFYRPGSGQGKAKGQAAEAHTYQGIEDTLELVFKAWSAGEPDDRRPLVRMVKDRLDKE
jgi:hypothetical protein